ncbi:hypothetical protein [Microcystis phage Mae-JY22]
MLARNKLLLYKVETTKGTDASPTPSANLIMPDTDLNIATAIESDSGAGELKGTFGPGLPVTTKQLLSLDFQGRVRGLGAGVAALVNPDIHPLLMASGHKVTTAGNGTSTPRSATYSPTSVIANLKSCTGYFYEDGLLWKLLGSVCDLSFEAQLGQSLKVKSKLQGKYTVPTTVGVPTFTAPSQHIFRATNTLLSFSDGSALNIGSFTFDSGTKVEEAYETGLHEFNVTDRAPMITIDPRSVASATEWNALSANTSFALTATFTAPNGETLVFTAPRAVLAEVTRQTRAGQIISQRKYQLCETTSDDQYEIEWTGSL